MVYPSLQVFSTNKLIVYQHNQQDVTACIFFRRLMALGSGHKLFSYVCMLVFFVGICIKYLCDLLVDITLGKVVRVHPCPLCRESVVIDAHPVFEGRKGPHKEVFCH